MIKNERQFKVTRSQMGRFMSTLENLRAQGDDDVDPIRRQLELDTIESLVTELRASLDEYEGLRDGLIPPEQPASIAAIPRALIQYRIAAGLSQRELADHLGLKEQQIQRYEADDWSSVNLVRLGQVANVLGIKLGGSLAPEAVSEKTIRQTVESVGIDREFLRRRLQPDHPGELATVVDLTARLSRIYGWTPADIVEGKISDPEPMLAAASFKLPKRHKHSRTSAYTVYSHYLALQAIAATPHLEPKRIPTDPAEFRKLLIEHGTGLINFDRALEVAWDLGVVVLPLADPGAFHAVLWRHEGRNVVVLKQQNRMASRWLFDLLHELRHAAEDPTEPGYVVLDDRTAHDAAGDSSERTANAFAGDVLLDGRAEELAAQAVEAAQGSVERLKSAVPKVARDNDVAVADLANYMAYRLSLQQIDWWGTATNLQSTSEDPFEIARDRFFEQVDLRLVNPMDRDLILQAIAE